MLAPRLAAAALTASLSLGIAAALVDTDSSVGAASSGRYEIAKRAEASQPVVSPLISSYVLQQSARVDSQSGCAGKSL